MKADWINAPKCKLLIIIINGSIKCEREEVLPKKKCGEWDRRKQPFKELSLSIREYGDPHRSQ